MLSCHLTICEGHGLRPSALGSKGDARKAKITLNGKSREVSQGGYDGFRWLSLLIEPDLVKGGSLKIRIERLSEVGAAFISQAKLTAP